MWTVLFSIIRHIIRTMSTTNSNSNSNSNSRSNSPNPNPESGKPHLTPTQNAQKTARLLFRLTLRALQFILGITVISLYSPDLVRASKAHVYTDGRWLFAVLTGTLSCVLALALVYLRVGFWFVLDVLVAFLWLVVFGIFGKMYFF